MTATAGVRTICNVIGGEERPALSGETFEKLAPATGELLSLVARSGAPDVDAAVTAAAGAQPAWAARTVEERGRLLRRIAQLLERDRDAVAAVVAAETGKSPKDSKGETDGRDRARLLHGRRGPALLRQDDSERRPEPVRR